VLYNLWAMLIAVSLLGGSTAGAATYTYKYTGAPLDRASGEPWPELLGSHYEFILSISEEKLGRPLKNAEIDVFWGCELNYSLENSLPCNVDGPIQAVTRMIVTQGYGQDLRDVVAGAWLHIVTGPSREILKGNVSFYDGPPDGWFGWEHGDGVSYGSDGLVYTQTQGQWRILSKKEDPLPIPAPAPIFLLMSGLVATWVATRKRQRGAD
jgi:hypothetical protein